jgi:hypothetical protein
MRNQSTTIADCSASLTPPVTCNHPDDVAEVLPQEDFRLHVRFFDGTQGTVDLSALIHSQDAGVFEVLTDPALFSQVRVEFGAVSWPCGLDLAPDAMYESLNRAGSWTPR